MNICVRLDDNKTRYAAHLAAPKFGLKYTAISKQLVNACAKRRNVCIVLTFTAFYIVWFTYESADQTCASFR